ncbi:DNA polymerase theta [Hylaeus anthracinus]|uniref:DNA polymerase theta n=1 Tax=Hylaeus anthracinus TaxID=313031 RepID=UPI0023B9E78A|nr:DNA polymerase theta [Hylaeus anthracinus]
MQSLNKMPSFGDDTLHACLQAEVKNNDSDMEKYFKDTIFCSKSINKSIDVDEINQSKQHSILHSLIETKASLNKNNLELEELKKDTIATKEINSKPNISNKMKLRSITSLNRNRDSSKIGKENISYTKSGFSSKTNTLSKKCKESKVILSKIRSNDAYNTMYDTTNSKSSNSNVTGSIAEKSSEINPSIITISTQERHKLASWGLPPNILQKYKIQGIKDMFAWQVECLSNHKVIEEKRNLIYSAPTSAGKTLVAEILMIKTVLERQKKVIFILPFISVVREKMYYFQDLLSDSGIRVNGFMGGVAPPGGFSSTHVAIATIEKANSLINRLMEENELSNLGAVVIDELHLVGDPNRGYLLELLLTKLKYMTLRDKNINIQLIGMSATLPNLSMLADWLDAELYKTEFRPIPLNEQCKIGKNIYDSKLHLIRSLTPMAELTMDTDDVLHLCIETISDGHSVLIFCPTKNWCEKLAEQIAATFFKLGQKNTQLGETLRQQLDSTLISETLEQLKRSPVGLDNVLKNTVSFGVAFHHAGLTMDERDIIEGSFRSGSLRVLIATSTLSSGVNLPARRVIVRSPMFGGKLLDSLTYKQMIGRAGRMGKDTAGESILICKSTEQKAAESLLSATLEPIMSCLEDVEPLIRALLEAIASEVVYTQSDLELYTKCTLINLCDEQNPQNCSNRAIKFLVNNEFLLLQQTEEGHRWVATAFGKACLAASIPPKDGLFLLEELQKARRCFVLDTELHVIYLVTPLSSGNQIGTIDWMIFLELWKMLSESERRVGQLVGVEERFLTSAIKGVVRTGKLLSIHRRFYTALALHDLVREVPLNTVCKKYGCCRGVLQSLQQSASTFAGMVTQFCKQLGWDCMELLVSQFQTRLQFGVCRELLDLLRLPMLNGLRARSLYKQGITCVTDLAVANELDVERALYKALPFESEKGQDGEHESEAVKRNKMRTVFVTGKDGLTPHEAAVMLVNEARVLVQNELKLQDMSWKQNEQSVITNESHTVTNSRIQQDIFQNTERIDIQTSIKMSTCTNSQIEVHTDKREQNLCPTSTPTIASVDEEKDLFSNNSCKDEKCKVNIHTIENDKDFECTLENKKCKVNINVVEDIKHSEYKVKKDVVEEDMNDGIKLTNQLLQIDIPEFLDTPTEKLSLDFFEVSSPKLMDNSLERRVSESLISFKDDKINRTQNITSKHLVNNIQSPPNTSNIATNKMKPASEIDTGISICANAIRRSSSFANREKLSISKSPSLFDDTLNLDTQICNVLEQNIIDSLHFSEFEETKLSGLKLASESKVKTESKGTKNVSNETQTEKVAIDKAINKNSTSFLNMQVKHGTLSWQDDSWNEPIKITEKLNQINDKINEVSMKHNIRHVKNTNIQHIVETAETSNKTPDIKKRYDIKFKKSIDVPDDLKKIPQKRRFSDISTEKSPVANVVVFCHNRTASLDSNKSDSDSIIIGSQNVNSPAASIKIRAKLDSEKKQKIYTQKVSNLVLDDLTKRTSSISNAIQIERCKIKPKLKEILANSIRSKDCSTDSMISNSDEDTPVKSAKILQKSKLSIKKLQKNSETCLQNKKPVNNANETMNWNTLNIVKVGSDRGTFNLFKREVMKKRYIALALNCEMYSNDINNIGSRIINSTERKKRSKKGENYVHGDKKLCGAAISWESNIAYYISFSNEQDLKVPSKEQVKLLKELLKNTQLNIKCFGTKEIFKTLYECCGISATCKFLDPKVASWLYEGTVYDKNFNEMVKEYFPQGCFITKRIGACSDTGPGLNIKSSIPGEFRAAAEAVLTYYMTDTLLEKLEQLSPTLLYTFKDIEMKTVTILACMELTGFGVSLKSLQDLSSIIREEMESLQKRAYTLSGKKFNFSSSKEVAEILGLYKGKKASVNKAVLEQSDHPVSSLIMSWRKLSTTQSKIIYPILYLAQHSSRIHSNCVTCTLTGRVSMHEPNLQNVPKDFTSEDNSFIISVRMAFVPAIGNIMLSADYRQLELRILAHFSKDAILCDIMRKPGDIFKNIAAKWNQVSEDQVDDKMRQHTKQLCYGMIYGMGVKTLAENLSVNEVKAKEFLESFMNAYPGISKWLSSVLEEAHINGYVTTILERRRILPGLNSTNSAEKSQAERQAVNTKVQGSAADIAKKAMVNIEERIRFEFPTAASVMPAIYPTRNLRSNSREAQQRGAYLVLQLHDELLYEVNINDLKEVATIVKESMEHVCQLAVPLPVKLRVGPAWGDLSEYTF